MTSSNLNTTAAGREIERYRTWIEISRCSMTENVNAIMDRVSKHALFLGVLKGNAWGFGTLECAKMLIDAGVDWLGLTTIEDAVFLRQKGIRDPILLLCEIPLPALDDAIRSDLRLTVCTEIAAKAISDLAVAYGIIARVHVKINTGLNRIGVSVGSAGDFIKYVEGLPNIKIEGAFTHFSCADRMNDDLTRKQLQELLVEVRKARKSGVNIEIVHAANTSSALRLPETHLDMVRIGMGIFGLYPSLQYRQIIDLKFPMTWKSRISFLRSVAEGESVGYCGRYKCSQPTRIATVPTGTADGLSKRFEGKGFILINGVKCKIVSVSMEQAMVDVGSLGDSVALGDEVVIIGMQGGEYIDPMFMADEIGADVEELLCQLSLRVPRVYVT